MPCDALRDNVHLIPQGHGKALDLACGMGGNAIFLAQNSNLDVYAWDMSSVAISKNSNFIDYPSKHVHTASPSHRCIGRLAWKRWGHGPPSSNTTHPDTNSHTKTHCPDTNSHTTQRHTSTHTHRYMPKTLTHNYKVTKTQIHTNSHLQRYKQNIKQ